MVPSMPIHHGYAYSLYYTCPDGTRVEGTQKFFIGSLIFARNPLVL